MIDLVNFIRSVDVVVEHNHVTKVRVETSISLCACARIYTLTVADCVISGLPNVALCKYMQCKGGVEVATTPPLKSLALAICPLLGESQVA